MIDELDAKRNKDVTTNEIFAIAWQTKWGKNERTDE